jgi:hypothetical protein
MFFGFKRKRKKNAKIHWQQNKKKTDRVRESIFYAIILKVFCLNKN